MVSDAAYSLLADRVEFNRDNFFVFQDADSGFNDGCASGWYASPGLNPADVIEVDPAGVHDPSAPGGLTAEQTRFDRERGTVMRIAFHNLVGTQYAGVVFEEPEGYFTELSGKGYDLCGATQIVFDAFSPTGLQAEIKAADGAYDEWRTFPPGLQFREYRMDLNAARLNSLNDVHELFVVGVSAVLQPANGELVIDNIRFEPVPATQAKKLSLPVSYETFCCEECPFTWISQERLPHPATRPHDRLVKHRSFPLDGRHDDSLRVRRGRTGVSARLLLVRARLQTAESHHKSR